MAGSLLIVPAVLATAVVFARWVVERARHNARLRAIPVRVHVNGIRGKSTVVRLLAGALRADGRNVVAKTTGSAPRVIDHQGRDHEIDRRGAPTLLEQLDFFRTAVPADTDAVIVECMAVRPDYQRASERLMVRSTLHLLTNVRQDHVEQLGRTLPAIARSMTAGFPCGGTILTAETMPEPLAELRLGAERLGSRFSVVKEAEVEEREMEHFGPFEFRANIALALTAARRLGVDRQTALAGMRAAPSDPGAASLQQHRIDGRSVTWVDLFSVNDPESAVENVNKAIESVAPETTVIFLLNNREDRPLRARQFADLVGNRFGTHRIVPLGAHRQSVIARLRQAGVQEQNIVEVADDPGDVDRVIHQLLDLTGTDPVMLIGMVNIHTGIAAALEQRLGAAEDDEAAAPNNRLR